MNIIVLFKQITPEAAVAAIAQEILGYELFEFKDSLIKEELAKYITATKKVIVIGAYFDEKMLDILYSIPNAGITHIVYSGVSITKLGKYATDAEISHSVDWIISKLDSKYKDIITRLRALKASESSTCTAPNEEYYLAQGIKAKYATSLLEKYKITLLSGTNADLIEEGKKYVKLISDETKKRSDDSYPIFLESMRVRIGEGATFVQETCKQILQDYHTEALVIVIRHINADSINPARVAGTLMSRANDVHAGEVAKKFFLGGGSVNLAGFTLPAIHPQIVKLLARQLLSPL